ncbi:MAG: response regulator, partial [Deltaproteobacteria bacterium]|nr:response regulator [Deltaproteobacteria bacterium]
LEKTAFDLGEVMELTHEALAFPAHEKNLELVCFLRPDVPRGLAGDPVRLRQVLTNLVGNAIKFTKEGEVFVEVKKSGKGEAGRTVELLFSVRDTGIGIEPDQTVAIFGRFSQADSSTTRRFGGSGLGLAISKQLIELMDGRIWVESKFGQGSTFYFTVRLEVQPQKEAYIPAPEMDLTGIRVLIVDDNATNRMFLRETLSGWGASPTEAAAGEAGLAEMRRAQEAGEPFTLVLLDQRMPGLDGSGVAQAIKRESILSETLVIMLTSDYQKENPARAKELGLSGYLIKPIKTSELRRAIAAALGKMEAAAPPRPWVSRPAFGEQTPLNILLVEDNEDNRMLILAYLKKTPHSVETAENGEIAVAKFKAGGYGLVLMDLEMPVMDGYAATRETRKWEAENSLDPTPIIALTAHALEKHAQKSLEAGCDDHLTKPIRKDILLSTINRYAMKQE